MKRRALIIYCTNTSSGPLEGPLKDAANLQLFLMSPAGGNWHKKEIGFLKNPTEQRVRNAVTTFLRDSDYTFVVFSGHGYIDVDQGHKQYMELLNADIPIRSLVSDAPRQTIIIDACRGYYSRQRELLEEQYSAFLGDVESLERPNTRKIFDDAILQAEKGLTVLYAASKNESALDTPSGGAYLFSLLRYSQDWTKQRTKFSYLPLKTAHLRSIKLMYDTFDTIQKPVMSKEKRLKYFPLAVKFPTLIKRIR